MPSVQMARPKLPVVISDADKKELIRRTREPSATVQAALRAKIVLLTSDGVDSDEIVARLQTSRVTVGLWRSRWLLQLSATTGMSSGCTLILDHDATHQPAKVKKWLERHLRFARPCPLHPHRRLVDEPLRALLP